MHSYAIILNLQNETSVYADLAPPTDLIPPPRPPPPVNKVFAQP